MLRDSSRFAEIVAALAVKAKRFARGARTQDRARHDIEVAAVDGRRRIIERPRLPRRHANLPERDQGTVGDAR